MADLSEIKRVAQEAARASITSATVIGIEIEPDVSWQGEDLLRIAIVIPDADADSLDPVQFVAATLRIKTDVRNRGEERHALVTYVTPHEMAHGDDPES